ncbi:uncharacterized protein MELLADRAFT_102580 [Melampsora larici-populina 98AG31]|uniref:Uncharacterized protein n=1 Tax=Melampsora larici-populina (strain 98AG31 / pathotype 3-4-7) TaxID=747676 RepID=F4R786_MELLP|nr:uncharacterized protein MELLADRAFT_102580 [Melampsora larici-populina 98AG31]EGG11564.1 hypothetical protein MELLADRAFT_102580 [Melampsora larici-populina 98AG31]
MSDYLTLESHPAWTQFQAASSNKDLIKHFDPDLEYRDARRDEMRSLMIQFGILPQYRRSTANKQILFDNYHKHLIPIIQPFMEKKTSSQIEIDVQNTVKLDVEAPSTTKEELCKELKKHVPTMRTTSLMDRGELIRTYQTSVLLEKHPSVGDELTRDSSTNHRFMTNPGVWPHQELLRKHRDDIRSALQFL